MGLSNQSNHYIRGISSIKAWAQSDARHGVKEIVRWLSSKQGKQFISFLYDSRVICDHFHTDDYQTAFFRLIDRRTPAGRGAD